jgi:hypothetical protein
MAGATLSDERIPDLSALGSVAEGYEHYAKVVVPGAGLALPAAYFKWYDIQRPDAALDAGLVAEARAYLQEESAAGRLRFSGQLGFIELHRCSSVVFLLVSAWKNDNELWLAPYVKVLTDTESGGFQPVEARDDPSRPVFCVWELAAVWHERQAWARYLRSTRDEPAKRAYLADHDAGEC